METLQHYIDTFKDSYFIEKTVWGFKDDEYEIGSYKSLNDVFTEPITKEIAEALIAHFNLIAIPSVDWDFRTEYRTRVGAAKYVSDLQQYLNDVSRLISEHAIHE